MLTRLLLAALFVPVAWGIHASHLNARQQVQVHFDANQQTSVLPPEFLQLMSLGNDSLLADILWLQMIQYYGTTMQQRLPSAYLYRYFDAISSLDPDFESSYVLASYLLADSRPNAEQALKLLHKGEENLPDSWRIPFQAGFVNYLQLKNPLQAAKDFERAARKPDAPDLPRRLAAQLYKKSNDQSHCQLSLRLWKDAYDQAPGPELRVAAERHLAETKILCDLLLLRAALAQAGRARQSAYQKALDEAKAKHLPPPKAPAGGPPASLAELVNQGLLPALPVDPFGRPYVYQPATGQIKAQALPWKPIDLGSRDIAQP